jgi:hypothetical protein
MAVLYRLQPQAQTEPTSTLPSAHELNGSARFELERARLQSVVARLGGPNGLFTGTFSPDMKALSQWTPPVPANHEAEPEEAEGHEDEVPVGGPAAQQPPAPAGDADQSLKGVIADLNVSMLEQLARCGLAMEAGYRIGRSLHDTVDPSPVADDVSVSGVDQNDTPDLKRKLRPLLHAFDPQRISTIQRWLTTNAASFPKDAAQLVSLSVGRWAAFVNSAFSSDTPGTVRTHSASRTTPFRSKTQLADGVGTYLLPQGDIWLSLLAGAESTQGLLTPEGYVAAAESALRRTGRIIRSVLRHYWLAALLLLGIVGFVLGLTFGTDWLGGPGKVWTTIAAAAGALGVTWKGISSAVPKLAEKGESPIFALEELDAMAWALTTLPPSQLTWRGVRQMRRAGVQRTSVVGRN